MYRLHARLALAVGVCALLFLAAADGARAQQSRGVAIVIHPETPITDLSMDQLRRIFMADQQYWSDRSRITLFVRAPAAYERAMVLDRIYRMSEDEFRKFWVGKMFRAEVPSGPKIVYSSEMAGELVRAVAGAIAFVPVDAVMEGVRVIRIDGRLPGEPGYPLQ